MMGEWDLILWGEARRRRHLKREAAKGEGAGAARIPERAGDGPPREPGPTPAPMPATKPAPKPAKKPNGDR